MATPVKKYISLTTAEIRIKISDRKPFRVKTESERGIALTVGKNSGKDDIWTSKRNKKKKDWLVYIVDDK